MIEKEREGVGVGLDMWLLLLLVEHLLISMLYVCMYICI